VVIDSGHTAFGITGEVAAVISQGAFDYLDAPVLRIGAPHNPVPCSKPLETLMIPSIDEVVGRALALCQS